MFAVNSHLIRLELVAHEIKYGAIKIQLNRIIHVLKERVRKDPILYIYYVNIYEMFKHHFAWGLIVRFILQCKMMKYHYRKRFIKK